MKTKRTNKGGRPSKYEERFISEVDKYLEGKFDEYTDGNKLTVRLPTIKGFALYIGVNETTLYEWDKEYPEFSKSLDKIKTEQHDRLVNSGLSGAYNPTIAKLILSSNHGMRERSDVTTDDEPIKLDVSEQLKKVYGSNDEVPGDSEAE